MTEIPMFLIESYQQYILRYFRLGPNDYARQMHAMAHMHRNSGVPLKSALAVVHMAPYVTNSVQCTASNELRKRCNRSLPSIEMVDAK